MTPVKVESDNCKIGEKIDVKVTFPDDYQASELSQDISE